MGESDESVSPVQPGCRLPDCLVVILPRSNTEGLSGTTSTSEEKLSKDREFRDSSERASSFPKYLPDRTERPLKSLDACLRTRNFDLHFELIPDDRNPRGRFRAG